MNNKSFIFNLEWYAVLLEYPEEVRFEVYEAIMRYASSGTLSDLKPLAKMAFSFIRKEMDYNRERYETTVERRREAGKKSAESKARKKQQVSTNSTNVGDVEQSQQKATTPTKGNYNDNDNDNDNDNVSSHEDKGESAAADGFEGLIAHFMSEGNRVNREAFAMKNHISEQRLAETANEVIGEWRLAGKPFDPQGDGQYLVNAVRVKIQEERRNEKKPTSARMPEESRRADVSAGIVGRGRITPGCGLIRDDRGD